jgi:hypothetical protein
MLLTTKKDFKERANDKEMSGGGVFSVLLEKGQVFFQAFGKAHSTYVSRVVTHLSTQQA